MTDLFWVWREPFGYRVVGVDDKMTPNRYADPPVLASATYETLANFFLQEGRNATIRTMEESHKPQVATDVGEPAPSGDLEEELLTRVYRQNRITS